jgi:hypothetical protein
MSIIRYIYQKSWNLYDYDDYLVLLLLCRVVLISIDLVS